MYEENLKPLPKGDLSSVFAELLAAIDRIARTPGPETVSPANVLHWAKLDIQPWFARVCRRLLLPGSAIRGIENLTELTHLAADGHSCIVCLNHQSNLDVPTLYTLLEDAANQDLFHRIIWIAGRKLHEDLGATRTLVQGFNRVIVAPRSWMRDHHSDEELHAAHQINMAAHRAMRELRGQGWVFALFPTATRMRPGDESTTHAIEETDSYLKGFEFMLLARIDGCTLPVSRDQDLTHEFPKCDRMLYTFSRVLRTDWWRADAARRFAPCDQRTCSARAIVEDIAAIETPESVE